jgi:hypothetical protein
MIKTDCLAITRRNHAEIGFASCEQLRAKLRTCWPEVVSANFIRSIRAITIIWIGDVFRGLQLQLLAMTTPAGAAARIGTKSAKLLLIFTIEVRATSTGVARPKTSSNT